jgi:hypothetical protein
MRGEMRTLMSTVVVLTMIAISPAVARRGHGSFRHGHSIHSPSMRAHSTSVLTAPANPTVPPSLTPDARLTGSAPSGHQIRKADTSAPGKRDPEDARIDQRIGSICRGC